MSPVKQDIESLIASFSKTINVKATMDRLNKYFDLVQDTNKITNLTNFKDQKFWTHGIYESLQIFLETLKSHPEVKTILDIGSGVGLPSLPLLIVVPNLKVTIVEPRTKRIEFLKQVKTELNLDLEIIKGKIGSQKFSNSFDLITARAVAPLEKLLLWSDSLANSDSILVFPKGKNLEQEIKSCKKIIKQSNLMYIISEFRSKYVEYPTYVFQGKYK